VTVYLNAARKRPTIKKNKMIKKGDDFQFSQVLYTLIGVVIVLGLSYGIIANKVVTTGYNIKATEKRLSDIKNENDELRIMISELKSVRVLEEKIVEIGMIEPVDVDYMSIGREVALKD
jgi:cell division protein FtsL